MTYTYFYRRTFSIENFIIFMEIGTLAKLPVCANPKKQPQNVQSLWFVEFACLFRRSDI